MDRWDVVDDQLESRTDGEYDERTFLYFLSVERSRADRADHALWLLLVTLEPVPESPVPIETETATRIFEELRFTLRETDIMGWYQQDRVAGALLSAPALAAGPDISHLIQQRVEEAIRRRLPVPAAHNLRVRVVLLRRPTGRK